MRQPTREYQRDRPSPICRASSGNLDTIACINTGEDSYFLIHTFKHISRYRQVQLKFLDHKIKGSSIHPVSLSFQDGSILSNTATILECYNDIRLIQRYIYLIPLIVIGIYAMQNAVEIITLQNENLQFNSEVVTNYCERQTYVNE